MKKIPLTRGFFALVDDKDYKWLSEWKWYADVLNGGRVVACTVFQGKKASMHRLITNCPKGKVVDHINHLTLDNQRKNLRICTYAENLRNQRKLSNKSSKYKGVSWKTQSKKWVAQIRYKNKRIHLGYFKNEKAAAMAYNKSAKKNYGKFAYLNKF